MPKITKHIRAALLLAFAAAMLPPLAHSAEPCKIRAFELPITMKGSRAVTTVGINGTQVPLLVDSGAFFSFLTPAAAEQLKLQIGPLPWGLRIEGLAGEVVAEMTTVKHMQLLGGDLPDMDFVVGGNEMGANAMGILGRNILHIADIEYDLAHGVIRLMFPQGDCGDKGMAYWAGEQPVSEVSLLRSDSRGKFPPVNGVVELNGRKMKVLFDTGASSLVSLKAAKRIGLAEADMKRAGRAYGVGRGYADAWIASFASFQIGGEKISNIRARVVDYDMNSEDMLLGIDFFLSHRIYISMSRRKMYFTYNGGPVFALSDVGDVASAAADAASAPELADADAYARRGAAAASRRDFVRALADLDRAVEMSPQVADYLVHRGQVHEALKQAPQALQDYEAALKLEPTQSDALLRRAGLRAGRGDREGALEDLQTLDRSLAPQANQRLQVAQAFVRLELRERAIPQWDQWIASHERDIGLAQALNERCWTRALLGVELDKALKDCNDAVDEEPDSAEILDSRGWVRLRRGELPKALADFDRALKLNHEMAWSLYGRGQARRKLGNAAAAQADLEAARKLMPSIDEQAARHGLAADPQPPAPTATATSPGS